MALKTTEIEKIHDLIELMKLNYEGATKLSLAEIKDFRKLLQDYSLHQENRDNLFYSKTIQCLVDSANEEHEIPGDFNYYIITSLSIGLGAMMGIGMSVLIAGFYSSIVGDRDKFIYKMHSFKKAFISGEFILETTVTLFTSSFTADLAHSQQELDAFYNDSLECLDFMPPQVIGSAPEYVEGD